MAGKGSKPRPFSNKESYLSNWDKIFNANKEIELKTYYVDIDGTICVTDSGDYPNSKPLLPNIAKINALFDLGHTIVYWTARGARSGIGWEDLTTSQLQSWGCKYTQLLMNKPHYDVWIDDKAINSATYFQ